MAPLAVSMKSLTTAVHGTVSSFTTTLSSVRFQIGRLRDLKSTSEGSLSEFVRVVDGLFTEPSGSAKDTPEIVPDSAESKIASQSLFVSR